MREITAYQNARYATIANEGSVSRPPKICQFAFSRRFYTMLATCVLPATNFAWRLRSKTERWAVFRRALVESTERMWIGLMMAEAVKSPVGLSLRCSTCLRGS
jgi:hypothetical protein